MVVESRIAEEDLLRAQYYRVLSSLLAAPPNRDAIGLVAQMRGSDTPLGHAVTSLGETARSADPEAVEREYHDLFIGVGRGELVPYGSFYLTGFLMEKPLASLREDMAKLGIERAEGVSEPEDHIASVCEIMAALIDGSHGHDGDIDQQNWFYQRNVGPWAAQFFEDLERAETADFYCAVGHVGSEFLAVEEAAIKMAA